MSNYTKEKQKPSIDIYCCPECNAENEAKENEFITCFDCGWSYYAL